MLSRKLPSCHLEVLNTTICAVVSVVLIVGFAPAASANSEFLEYLQQHPIEKRVEYTRELVDKTVPQWPNPYLSFLPAEAKPDFEYWRARMRFEAEDRGQVSAAGAVAALIATAESEPNDTQATANHIDGFGTQDGEDPEASVAGSLELQPVLPATAIGPFAEDEGSIPLASETGLGGGVGRVTTSATIGDGPFGSSGTGSGDFDFYRIAGVTAFQTITVDIDSPVPSGPLDSFVVIYDSAGGIVAFNDDDPAGGTGDSFLTIQAAFAGDYYVSVGGLGSFALDDPTDSSSGPGVGSEGVYDVTIALGEPDVDYYSFDLAAGDVFGASLDRSGMQISLLDPSGTLRVGSQNNLSFIYPDVSPLPSGQASSAYVIESAGTWFLQVTGTATGAYNVQLRVFEVPLRDGELGEVQTIFLDFDGAIVDVSTFTGGPPLHRALSPLLAFLPGWGLGPADENAVIDSIIAAFEENTSVDVRSRGNNGDFDATRIPGDFDVEILNSRDHADPAGTSNLTRIVIGGSIPELTLRTIGIAASIDPGNFETDEIGVVLLDLLSAPSSNPNSLNGFPLGGGADIIDIVGIGVGNIAAHEAGHVLGNFHTNQFVGPENIMDQGGNLAGTVGVGPDGIFGTSDDVDVDFGVDVFVANEGFSGIEDTLNVLSFDSPTSDRGIPVAIDIRPRTPWNKVNLNRNGRLPVAILGSEVFDVRDVDIGTIAFARFGASPIHRKGHFRDVNSDGLEDLFLHFRILHSGIEPDDTEACLFGMTLDGLEIAGCDSVVIVPRGSKCSPQAAAHFGLTGIDVIGPENGDFETGDFTGWGQITIGSGGIVIDDGTFDPVGPGGPVPPFEGSFGAATSQSGPSLTTLYTDVTLDPFLSDVELSWADNLQNHAGEFVVGIQEWRVEVWDPVDNALLGELYSTSPGDPPFQDWTEHAADLDPWVGQTIRIAFTRVDIVSYFNARLDAVQVTGVGTIEVGIDVQPGSEENRIQIFSEGVTPVAILGSDEFNVRLIDPATLLFGPNRAPAAHSNLCTPERFEDHVEDVNEDGYDDLVTHYRTTEAGIEVGDREVCLYGRTQSGLSIEGCDAILPTPFSCGLGFEFALLLGPAMAFKQWRKRRIQDKAPS